MIDAQLILCIDGDDYLIDLLPSELSRFKARLARRGSKSRVYEIEELLTGTAFCQCKGFGFKGACKHLAALRQVGLLSDKEDSDGRMPA